jgi:hypothetical protein
VPRRRAGHLRTQDAALSAAAYRRPPRLPRPPRHAAPASQLALGRPARRRVRAPAGAPTARMTARRTRRPSPPAAPSARRIAAAKPTPAVTARRHRPPAGPEPRRQPATPRSQHRTASPELANERLTHDRGLNPPDDIPTYATASPRCGSRAAAYRRRLSVQPRSDAPAGGGVEAAASGHKEATARKESVCRPRRRRRQVVLVRKAPVRTCRSAAVL